MSESVPLKEHLLAIIDERDKRYEQRFQAQEKAITKAETSFDYRIMVGIAVLVSAVVGVLSHFFFK